MRKTTKLYPQTSTGYFLRAFLMTSLFNFLDCAFSQLENATQVCSKIMFKFPLLDDAEVPRSGYKTFANYDFTVKLSESSK